MYNRNWSQKTSWSIKFIFGGSALALITSELFKFFWHVQPCTLCKIQSLIYLFLVFACGYCIVAIRSRKAQPEDSKRWGKNNTAWMIISSIALLGFIVSVIHFAIQLQLIEDVCSIEKVTNLEAFKETIFKQRIPSSCAKITLSIFGVPASGLNTAIFFSFFGVALTRWIKAKKNAESVG